MDFVKNVHLVISIQKDGKNYAYAVTESGCNNLAYLFKHTPGIKSANVCASHKQARIIAAQWNASYSANGTHMYSQQEDSELDCVALPF